MLKYGNFEIIVVKFRAVSLTRTALIIVYSIYIVQDDPMRVRELMRVNPKGFFNNNLRHIIRAAIEVDFKNLSEIRFEIDGETENLDTEKGEAYIDETGFKQ